MSAAEKVDAAVCLVWFGMVVAISFIEAPLKFRAPDVTLRIGLGIGRLVFRALNGVEAALAVAVLVSLVLGPVSRAAAIAAGVAIASLAVQLAGIRPQLTRRSNAVLAGEDAPRSRAHYAYIGVELVKTAALMTGAVLALAA